MRKITAIAAVAICLSCVAQAQQSQPDGAPKVPTVRRIAFSPDGKLLAVAYGAPDSLVVWDVASLKRKLAIPQQATIQSVAYSPQGDQLAVAMGKAVTFLNASTGEQLREIAAHDNTVRSIAFSASGKQLATGGNDRTVKLWNLETGAVDRTIADCSGNICSVALSPDGARLAAACDNNNHTVKLWSVSDATQPPKDFDFGQAFVPQVTFSPDSRYLAAPNFQGTVRIISVDAGESFQFREIGGAYCAAFSPDAKWLAIATGDRALPLFSFELSPNAAKTQQIMELIQQFKSDNYTKRESATNDLTNFSLLALPLLRSGLESPTPEVRVRCRRLIQKLLSVESAKSLTGHEAELTWVAFSPDSRILASGDRLGVVKLWDVASAISVAALAPN
jgi:WD40 repeat protein